MPKMTQSQFHCGLNNNRDHWFLSQSPSHTFNPAPKAHFITHTHYMNTVCAIKMEI